MTCQRRPGSLLSFTAESGLVRVRDELEEQELDVHVTAPEEIELQPALTDLFLYPVDDAVTVTVSELRVDELTGTAVWDDRGEHLGEFTATPREFSRGTYFVQILGSVKAYVRIADTPFSGVFHCRAPQNGPLELSFPEPTRVTIGARSLHTRPQATITVPDDPRALREALPYLGSSIKEFSCERSWPTLRGHPPAIDRGDRLEIPGELSKPETGVTIAVPDSYADLYRVAPLAFYLGADVVVGDRPELRLENGYVEPLETPAASLEACVDELLGRCLLLDSLTRADGYFSERRYEYEELAPNLPFYPPNLYDASLSDQLMEYLEVSFDDLEPYVPEWPMTAVFRPHAADAELLPFVLDTLSRIHVDGDTGSPAAERNDDPESERSSSQVTCYCEPNPPAGAGLLLGSAFEPASTRRVPDVDDARFAYVTGESERADRARAILDGSQQETGDLTETITVVEAPTSAELERALEAERDFLFCDVPTSTDDGALALECADDPLRVADLERVGATALVVCGRESTAVGVECVRRGALTGAALEAAIPPRRAIRVARVLLRGHVLVEGLEFAGVDELTSWRVFGNPMRSIVRCAGGLFPVRIDVESVDEDEHELSLRFASTNVHEVGGIGRLRKPYSRPCYQLIGLTVDQPYRISTDEVVALLEDPDLVARVNGEAYHGETDAHRFVRESARRARFDVY